MWRSAVGEASFDGVEGNGFSKMFNEFDESAGELLKNFF